MGSLSDRHEYDSERGMKKNKSDRSALRQERNQKNVLKLRSVVLVTSNYGLLAMAFILWDETIPLFLKLDISQGGFGLDSSNIGLLLSSSGGVMLIFTSVVLPRVAKMSKKSLFRIGMYGALPVCLMIPMLATMKKEYAADFMSKEGLTFLWVMLVLCCVLKNVAACISFTA